jgi:hypothetical protein
MKRIIFFLWVIILAGLIHADPPVFDFQVSDYGYALTGAIRQRDIP